MEKDFKDFLQFIKSGQKYSRYTDTKNFTVIRFKLDEEARPGTRGMNVFNQSFLSFWVADTNKRNFNAQMSVNDSSNSGDSLPLKLNMCPSFEYPVDGCTLTWDAQPDVWVDIVFAHKSKINVGSNDTNLKGVIVTSDGSDYDHGSFTANDTPKVILNADDSRGVSTIFNYSDQILFLGKKDVLESAEYGTKALRCLPDKSFSWRNSAALYARTGLAETSDIVVLNEGV